MTKSGNSPLIAISWAAASALAEQINSTLSDTSIPLEGLISLEAKALDSNCTVSFTISDRISRLRSDADASRIDTIVPSENYPLITDRAVH